MKSKQTITIFLSIVLMLPAVSIGTSAWASPPQKCGGADIANGPFAYTALGVTESSFNGTGGAPVTTSFTITAPLVDPKQQTDATDVFPGNGQEPCPSTADATISALEIQKVGDSNGDPITPVKLDTSFGLGLQIANAFQLLPEYYTFGIGETIIVTVAVSNPDVSPADYGDYDVKLAAQAPGYGIGVGDGPHFFLSLRAPTATDTTPPVVTVTKPTGEEILGVIPVEIQAYDPNTPPATGLASMSATVSSAGGAVSNLPISLTLDSSLPVAAGITVTGTGSFTPTGGTPGPGPGTTDAQAFTSSSRSGIGSYIINAQATDGAGNIGRGSKSFKVNYYVNFSQQSAPPPCADKIGNSGRNCTAMFQFTVNRSNITSDGAFMYDHTVVVALVRTSDSSVMATHTYGTGSILSEVQIVSTPIYQTHFKRGDLSGAPSTAGTYRAEVYFLDVDNNWVLQATSNPVMF